MRVLVTGGAGFIGSHVADAYLAAGHEVAILDDLSTGKLDNVNPQARFFHADLRQPEQLTAAFDDFRPEVICHLAAKANVRESMLKPVLYAEVNVIGSINLLETARAFSCNKFIYASTAGAVYGEPEYLPVDENHPINPLDPYGASKHHVEHYLYLYQRNYGLNYTVLRYPNVYGPRQDPHGEAGVVSIFALALLENRQPVIHGDGEQSRDFVYVGDIAQASVLALPAGDGQTYNLGAGESTSINTVFRLLKDITGSDQPEVHGPAKLGEVFRTCIDATKARRELGWQPTTGLREGLERTVDYFRN
ncbi:MAG: NAD-dependent epimerase/dehydratase family protein [Chloroflexi bacterium]|nr:NAD-dependent epimerase/dehydratase family protein [Chloroflexota bacterium]